MALRIYSRNGKKISESKTRCLVLINSFQQTQKKLEVRIQPIVNKILEENKLSKELYNSLNSNELFELWRQLKQPSKLFNRFLELPKLENGKLIELQQPFLQIVAERKFYSFIPFVTDFKVSSLRIEKVDKLPTHYSKNEIYLCPEKLVGDLKIRKWKKGDRIKPIGIDGGQTVAKIIKDSVLSSREKENVLVVHDDKNIHWVVGLKIGRNAISKKVDDEIWKVIVE